MSEDEAGLNFDIILIDLKTDLAKLEVIYEGTESHASEELQCKIKEIINNKQEEQIILEYNQQDE